MLRSMTGYGRQETSFEAGVITIEIRSVNHRYLELGIRLPDEIRALEPVFRERVATYMKRGKIDLSVKYQPGAGKTLTLVVDQTLAEQVIEAAGQLRALSPQVAEIDPMRVLGWPGVVGAPSIDHEELHRVTLKLLDLTIKDFIDSRAREGQKTELMLSERADGIESIVAQIRTMRPAVVEKLNKKLRSRISELDVTIDSGRLEQELVYAAQRLDVTEELDRLDAHVSELRAIFARTEPVGRRLDFLIQEFNREANTLSSKAADTDTTKHGVELKVLIEQMREQVQNVE